MAKKGYIQVWGENTIHKHEPAEEQWQEAQTIYYWKSTG